MVTPWHPGLAVGDLLVATFAMDDPQFDESVVVLLDVNDEGVIGVVLTKPTPVPIRDVLPAWSHLADDPGVLFQGGPVGLDSALALGRAKATPPAGFRSVLGDVGLVDLDQTPDRVGDSLREMRIFAGYAGWGAGQVDREIVEGAWHVVQGMPSDVFCADPLTLRRDVLRRQHDALAWESTRPDEPEMN